jgi:DNA-directed RNA polymerase specialized sigma24 family protein
VGTDLRAWLFRILHNEICQSDPSRCPSGHRRRLERIRVDLELRARPDRALGNP